MQFETPYSVFVSQDDGVTFLLAATVSCGMNHAAVIASLDPLVTYYTLEVQAAVLDGLSARSNSMCISH